METVTILTILALVFGFYMAWSIGANDVANAMGTSVGSGALTLKRAVILAAILEFAGAFFVGGTVSETVRKGIVSFDIFTTMDNGAMLFVYGMLASLLAAGAWLQLASYYGWPVSTTHSIVGAILGFGAVVGGMDAVHWSKVTTIAASWVVSPVLSAIIAFIVFSWLRKVIFNAPNPLNAVKKVCPILVFFVFAVLALVLVFKGLKNLNLDLSFTHALLWAAGIGFVSAVVSSFLVRRIRIDYSSPEAQSINPEVEENLEKSIRALERVKSASAGDIQYRATRLLDEVKNVKRDMVKTITEEDKQAEDQAVERVFTYLQILSACFVAFAHGANDVANAIGPLSGILAVLKTGSIQVKSDILLGVLALGGVGIVIGLATWGWRVMETIGKKITELTPTRGFTAEFSAAITIVFASKLGLPISTTHTLVGAVLGVGLARGMGALNLGTIRDIVISWVITVPAGALFSIIFFYILRFLIPIQ